MPIHINTPTGTMAAPPSIASKIEKMTDIELLKNLVDGPFVDPFVLGEIQKRTSPLNRTWTLPFYAYADRKATRKYLESLGEEK